MPRRFVGSRVFGASSGDRLFIERTGRQLVTVTYQPSESKLKESRKYRAAKDHSKAKRKLLEFGGRDGYLCIYPLNTLPTHSDFLKPKYERIKSIRLEGFDFEAPSSLEDVYGILDELPSGFVKDFSYGLGLLKDYRFIVDAIERIPEVKHLAICKGKNTEISNDCYRLSFRDYDALRRGMNRIAARQQDDAARDKWILAHNSLLTSLAPKEFPEEVRPYRKDTIYTLISNASKKQASLSPSDQRAAIDVVEHSKREIAERDPEQLLRLRKDIELVTLEVLIARFEAMLAKDLPEARWQKIFNENPFILNLAFGYPVIKIRDQAHVGGRKLSGSGETITDFLVKNRISNNAALLEIKTPGTPLLKRKAYRENLYTPSSDLSGAVSQMLDQKNKFQKEVAALKENSRIPDLESYAVHGVLVIGTTPQDVEQQKSFELFRGNSKDITIITFDELLTKLKLLHEFFSSEDPEARRVTALRSLETDLVRLQDGLHGLFRHTKKKLGSYSVGETKPLPGVDGTSVASAIGKLGILKHGFDRVRVKKPPYTVGFDNSGEHTVGVQTEDEFIVQAERVIAEAGDVLASQSIRKRHSGVDRWLRKRDGQLRS